VVCAGSHILTSGVLFRVGSDDMFSIAGLLSCGEAC
jgi:hypothetical protein